MNDFQIRLAEPEKDFPRLAALLSAVWQEAVTAEQLHEWENYNPLGQIRRRMVVERDGHIVGYSSVFHGASDADGRFELFVAVDPKWRRQGLGRQLYDEALAWAEAQGAAVLDSEVREEDASSLRFAEQRGFGVDRHMFESVITLQAFDPRQFDGLVESLRAEGIRIFSLADGGSTQEALYKLYEVNRDAALDDPASHGTFASFEEFMPRITSASWFRPEGQILAADGERYVGLSAVGYFAHTNSMYNMMTGVIRPYRGRGIATALKLLTVEFAKNYGADTIRTHNDSQNGPMLAINRKLGYVAQPGVYRLVKQ